MKLEEKLPTQAQSTKKTVFETKIAPLLQYIGAIGAIVMAIAYIVIVMVLIVGFKAQNLNQTVIFALVNAAVGLIIMQLLKMQGISFARHLPDNKEAIDAYYNTKTKDKKLVSIESYWWKSVFKDICFKGISITFSTVGLIYIVIQGSNDYNLLLIALVNLFMFTCFGLLALNSAYEFYNTRHIPYIVDQVEQTKRKETLATEVKVALSNLSHSNENSKIEMEVNKECLQKTE